MDSEIAAECTKNIVICVLYTNKQFIAQEIIGIAQVKDRFHVSNYYQLLCSHIQNTIKVDKN